MPVEKSVITANDKGLLGPSDYDRFDDHNCDHE
jgi:hypothetical protein